MGLETIAAGTPQTHHVGDHVVSHGATDHVGNHENSHGATDHVGKLERLREIHKKAWWRARVVCEKNSFHMKKKCWGHDDLTTCRYISVILSVSFSVRLPLNFS